MISPDLSLFRHRANGRLDQRQLARAGFSLRSFDPHAWGGSWHPLSHPVFVGMLYMLRPCRSAWIVSVARRPDISGRRPTATISGSAVAIQTVARVRPFVDRQPCPMQRLNAGAMSRRLGLPYFALDPMRWLTRAASSLRPATPSRGSRMAHAAGAQIGPRRLLMAIYGRVHGIHVDRHAAHDSYAAHSQQLRDSNN